VGAGTPAVATPPSGTPAVASPTVASPTASPAESGDPTRLPSAADPQYAARVRLALYAADVGAWDYDLLSGAVWWDPRCGALLGADPAAIRTYADLLALVHPDDRAELTTSWQPFLDPAREGECYEHVFRTVATDDWLSGERRVAIRGRMLFEMEDGVRRATRLLGTLRDVTAEWERDAERERLLAAERAARHEAEEANTDQARFLTTVSRELRMALNAVGGHAALMAMGVLGPVTPAQADALARIALSKEQLVVLVNTVLLRAYRDLPPATGDEPG
jgi:signal transduction histidine kinase